MSIDGYLRNVKVSLSEIEMQSKLEAVIQAVRDLEAQWAQVFGPSVSVIDGGLTKRGKEIPKDDEEDDSE